MNAREEYPQVEVRPFDCLARGKDLIGDQYWLFFGMALLAVVIMSALPLVLQGPLYCGMYLCLLGRERGEKVPFERMFKGFDVFLESFVATLIYSAAALVVSVPFVIALIACFAGGAAAMEERNEELGTVLFVVGGLAALVFMVVCVILSVLFTFAYPLIVDRKLKAMDAVRTSVKSCARNFWGLTGLLLLNAAISIVLAALCYVPLFFFLPILFASTWIAYRKVFPALREATSDDDGWAELDVPEVT